MTDVYEYELAVIDAVTLLRKMSVPPASDSRAMLEQLQRVWATLDRLEEATDASGQSLSEVPCG